MRVLITGSKGFIGTNLIVRLNELAKFDIVEFDRNDNIELIKEKIDTVDAVIHLAGENRPNDMTDFEKTNVGLTEYLCSVIADSGRKIPVLLASSVYSYHYEDQISSLHRSYGKSKFRAEKVVSELESNNGNPVVIYRLPGVFGKWARPNYNSVIATFCHNIANGLPVHIDDPSKSIHLVYIDDLVQNIIDILGNIPSGLEYRKVTPEYSYTLGQIAEKIHSFRDSEKTLITDRVGTGFVRRLYATYLSYIPIDKVSYSLPVYADERGDFVEVLKTKDSGQFSYFTVLPGVTRGGHYHHTKNEKFVVLNGTARFKFRNISTGETKQIICSSGRPKVVNTFPGWAHDITNIGDSKMLVMIWANEIFDRDFPDTISWTL